MRRRHGELYSLRLHAPNLAFAKGRVGALQQHRATAVRGLGSGAVVLLLGCCCPQELHGIELWSGYLLHVHDR